MIPTITVPSPYVGLWRIFQGGMFYGWLTHWGWAARFLLADDWRDAGKPSEWIDEQQFGYLMTAPLSEYRLEEVKE